MKKKITLTTDSGKTDIIIGEKLSNIGKYASGKDTVLITEENVAELYRKSFSGMRMIIIPGGEKGKTLKTVEYIYKKLYSMDADRNTFIAAAGGGVITDVAGFAAATYMRGLTFGFAPTTLLSQVDAGVGGKNGVNLNKCKNMVGTFRQPSFVLVDIETLDTLPQSEFLSGIGEIVKHAVIGGGHYFSILEKHLDPADLAENKVCDAKGRNITAQLVKDSIMIKAGIVSEDEKEAGQRRILNLGHTMAHAVEMEEKLPHGIAVLKGLMFAADFSHCKGFLSALNREKIKKLLEKTGVDLEIKGSRKKMLKLLSHDKKRYGEEIYFVYINKPGSVFTEKTKLNEIAEAMDDLCIGR